MGGVIDTLVFISFLGFCGLVFFPARKFAMFAFSVFFFLMRTSTPVALGF